MPWWWMSSSLTSMKWRAHFSHPAHQPVALIDYKLHLNISIYSLHFIHMVSWHSSVVWCIRLTLVIVCYVAPLITVDDSLERSTRYRMFILTPHQSLSTSMTPLICNLHASIIVYSWNWDKTMRTRNIHATVHCRWRQMKVQTWLEACTVSLFFLLLLHGMLRVHSHSPSTDRCVGDEIFTHNSRGSLELNNEKKTTVFTPGWWLLSKQSYYILHLNVTLSSIQL